MEKYCEQLTQAYKSGMHRAYTVLMFFLVAVFLATITNLFPVNLIFAVLAVLCYFAKQREYVEYEYTFTSGDVDIDRIVEARKRKRVISFDIKDIYMMAPVGSASLDGAPNGKEIKAYPKDTRDTIFKVIIKKDGKVSEVCFIPNEEFINQCFRANPRCVKRV